MLQIVASLTDDFIGIIYICNIFIILANGERRMKPNLFEESRCKPTQVQRLLSTSTTLKDKTFYERKVLS